jgi:methanogenic corrinoid protein MtbC1
VPSYPIRAVAKITGLSLDTLRAWERRHKAVVPERSHRGRLYGTVHIERLLLLGQLVQKGHAIGGIASLSDQELHGLLAESPQPAKTAESLTQRDILAPVLSALERFDSAAAHAEVGRLAATLTPRNLVYQVMVPLMHEVGVRWHDGALAVAQEHMASQIIRDVLGSLICLFRPFRPSIKMVFATPAGEMHEFGIQAAAMLASMTGIEPVYLGANLPAKEIGATATKTGAQVIVLGITLPSMATQAEVRAIAASMPEATTLWIGGAGSEGLDASGFGRRAMKLKDLPAFEAECQRYWASV